MSKCAVTGCTNATYRDKENQNKVSFYRFPKLGDPRRRLWEKAAGNSCIAYDNKRICSSHFAKDAFSLKTQLLNLQGSERALTDKAIPTLLLPEPPKPPSARDNRMGVRKRRALAELVLDNHSDQIKKRTESQLIEKWRHMETQTM